MASAHGGAGGSLFARLRSGLNFSFSSGSACVGLSIGASTVKVAELKKKKDSWMLIGYGSAPLHDSVSNQREILNSDAIVAAVREAMAQASVSSKQVCSSIVGSGVIIKTLSLVVTDMKELTDSVFWEAEQYIPFDISEVVIDFQVLKRVKDQVEVILVAVKKDFLEQYISAIESANLVPKIMDVEVFALQNVFENNYRFSDTSSVLLVDIGAMSTKTIICAGGTPLFTKDASYGGVLVTNEIQKELKLPSFMDAEALKVSANLPQEVGDIAARMSHVLGAELKKSIDFYTASSLGPPISAVYLSGGGARAEHLPKIVEDYVGLPVMLLNPFEKISVEPKRFSEELQQQIASEAVIPIGLAIRAGDKQ